MATKVAKKPLQKLINETREARGWTWETFAEKVRAAGMSCTGRSLYRWGQGFTPHANNEMLLRQTLRKL